MAIGLTSEIGEQWTRLTRVPGSAPTTALCAWRSIGQKEVIVSAIRIPRWRKKCQWILLRLIMHTRKTIEPQCLGLFLGHVQLVSIGPSSMVTRIIGKLKRTITKQWSTVTIV